MLLSEHICVVSDSSAILTPQLVSPPFHHITYYETFCSINIGICYWICPVVVKEYAVKRY